MRRILSLALLCLLLASGCAAPADSPEHLVSFFRSVAFGSEYGDTPPGICKWTAEIVYAADGDVTEDDRAFLALLAEAVGSVPGFPGIREAAPGEAADLTVSFLPREAIDASFPGASAADGFAFYTFSLPSCEIRTAHAVIDSSLGKDRRSVIAEEFLQSLGFASDEDAFRDSLFYQRANVLSWPGALDLAALALLYDPAVLPGMTEAEALPVLRELAGVRS